MRTINLNNNYESSIHLIDEEKMIYKLYCQCGDFQHRRIKKVGAFSETKYFAEACKHLQPIVDVFQKQGYTLKKHEEMTGDDKLSKKLRNELMERSNGCCERKVVRDGELIPCGCKDHIEVHRKVPKTHGGKYNMDNCIVLCKVCHVEVTYQPWHKR